MRCRRVQRAARIDAGVARAGRVSPRRGRVRAVVAQLVVRSVGVSPRAPGGGGEPRAVRAAARCRSVSPRRAAPAARRRAISLHTPAARAPRLRPVFLWTRQRRDGLVQAVHCEDYDARNRLRVARTTAGWRVIPRTAVFDAIAVPPRPRRRPRRARPAPPPPEPTPLDSLLAVAELELREQAMSLEASAARADAAHAALFESLSEAHYLPALPAAPHDDALLESLVEKGCEDNHVLGQALDKLAALAARGAGGAGGAAEGGERQLASPRRSMSAAQGLLHLHELPYSAPHYAPHLHDLHTDLPADLHADLPADLHADLHAELSGPGDLHEHLDVSRDLHGDLHDHLSMAGDLHDALSVPDDLHGDLSMPGDLQSDLSVPGDLSSELHGDLSMTGDLPSDISSAIANELPQPKSEDISSEIPCELLSEMTNDMPCEMISEMTCEIPSEISCEISSEMPCEIPSAMTEKSHREMTPNTNVLTEINKSAIETCTEPIQEELKTEENCEPDPAEEELAPKLETLDALADLDYLERMDDSPGGVELVPTDLRVNKNVEKKSRHRLKETAAAKKPSEDNFLARNYEQPRDLSVPKRLGTPAASPRRPPSRESDAAQSPQPSGIPAVPCSPELCAATSTKTKQTLFLESLLSSPSPKMYTSEVTITKQQCEPLNLGKHRKSASPTITSCTDEMKTLDKDFAEPQEKKVKRESTEDLTKLNKEFDKSSEDYVELIPKKTEPITSKLPSDATPLQQLQFLKTNPEFNIPDPLLIPKDRLNLIISAPAVEIPALLSQRPELRIPQALAFPSVLQDPNNIIISLSQIEQFIENDSKKVGAEKSSENKTTASKSPATSTEKDKCNKVQSDSTSQPKPIPSMDALAGDIDAATSAALNQMLWLPYLSQLEAMATCSQNMDFLKALHSSGYPPPNYSDMSQMFPSSRLMNPAGFPMMSQMDYDNRMQLAMWQEQMNHANNAASQRPRPASIDAQIKEMSKSTDVQNPYVHSTKNHQGKTHSAARTSPIAHNYNNQRSMNHNPYMQGMQSMYPGMNPTIRPNVPLPGLQIPYFNPNMGSQRSPRTAQQKSPTSPYFPNNNYLQSLKQQAEAPGQQQRSGSVGSQESPRPRISVKSLQNLLEPTAAAASGMGSSLRRTPSQAAAAAAAGALGRRREDTEVGSTTPLGEQPALPHPHDPASFHLWHPLFGNHKSYNSPWSWTTVTATGD